ncbi:MAG TPA: hypothetical protein DCE44_18310 [Verrucomicrobiales bacterium]|nr:hypothetical protein [Verrucomicrobiales bacterium]
MLAITGPLGCSKSDSPDGSSSAAAPALDLSKVEGAFSSATGAIKAEWDKVATAIKSQDYAGAWSSLQALASNAGLSADQKSSLSDLMAQVKAKAGDALKSATDAATKAAAQAKDAASKATDAATKAAGSVLPK